jgi:hypothetical protein
MLLRGTPELFCGSLHVFFPKALFSGILFTNPLAALFKTGSPKQLQPSSRSHIAKPSSQSGFHSF